MEYMQEEKMARADLEKYNKRLKKYLDESRFYHTQGVRYTATAMAMAHGVDLYKAELAGLLHDSAKNIPDDKKIKLCKKHNIPMTEIELQSPYLLHSKLGAYIAEAKYDVHDEDVLEAIRNHTTGKPNMNPLDQIIFIADYIEPRRDKAPNLPEVRRMAFLDLDECCYIILRDTLNFLKSKKAKIDSMTEEAYNFYNGIHCRKYPAVNHEDSSEG